MQMKVARMRSQMQALRWKQNRNVHIEMCTIALARFTLDVSNEAVRRRFNQQFEHMFRMVSIRFCAVM